MILLKLKAFVLLRARLISVIALVLALVACCFGARLLTGLNTQYSIRQFMNLEDPHLKAEFKVKDDFELPSWPFVYVDVSLNPNEKGTILEKNRIISLRIATEKSSALNGVTQSISIATVEGASSTPNGLTVGKILDLTPEKDWQKRVLADPLFTPNLVSKDARTALVAVAISDFSTELMNTLPDQLRTLFQNQFPQSKIRIGGIPAIQGEMADLLKNELRNFLGLALLACIITLAAFFKDLSSIFVPILLVAIANIGALSWMVIAKISFTVLSTTLPVLVSIIVLSMVTHTMICFASDWKQALRTDPHSDKIDVIYKTFKNLFLPNLLTALTTSLGFVALLSARVPLIHDYAECVAIGVVVAWFCVMFALPATLTLAPVPQPRAWTSSRARWALVIMRNKKVIVFSVLLLACALAWKGKNLNWTARLFDDLPQEREARSTSEFIDQNLGAVIPLDLVISKNEPDFWNSPDQVEKLRLLLLQVRSTPGIGSAIGISDFIEAGSRAQNTPLPTTRAGVAEMIFLYSLSSDRVTNQYLTPDGTQTRLAIRIRDLPGDEMEGVLNQIRAKAEKIFPNLDVKIVGMAANIHEMNNELCRDLIYGFWQAIILISLLLVIVFRSVKWTLIAMLPNLISPIALMGVMAITKTPIKPGIALIFSIALGIAYNNTVYLLGRIRLLQKNRKEMSAKDVVQLVTRAWYQEGNPCVFSTLALVGGFIVFLASYFELNRLFGAYMLLSIAAGMLGDLVFLPALLGLFPALLFRLTPPKADPQQKLH